MKHTKEQKTEINKIRKKIGAALEQYNMLQANDKIVVGLSGGKDSLCLLDLLAFKQKQLPFSFDLIAVHIQSAQMFYETDINYLKTFCMDRNIRFIKESIDFKLDDNTKACFICSWTRRKTLFDKAHELNATKIALGHHLNDSVETLLMNMIFHASISAIPPKLSMFDNTIELIRPLIKLKDSELVHYADLLQFNLQKKECLYEHNTQRDKMRELIKYMEKIYPKAVNNIAAAMSNIYPDYLIK